MTALGRRCDTRLGHGRGFALAEEGLAASGVAVSVANPFRLLWWATIGAAYVAASLEEGAAGVGA